MALVAGIQAPPGRIMGHAGAWTAPGEPGPEEKYKALERAGAVMVNHPEKFGKGMRTLLTSKSGVSASPYCLTKAHSPGLHLWNPKARPAHAQDISKQLESQKVLPANPVSIRQAIPSPRYSQTSWNIRDRNRGITIRHPPIPHIRPDRALACSNRLLIPGL